MANSLKELEELLKETIQKSLNSDVRHEIENVYKNKIMKEVYEVYDPKVYQRRYSLIQDKNIKHEISQNTDGLELTIWNEAPYNKNYGGTLVDLPELIEYGHGYNDNYYDYPFNEDYTNPRPFTEETINELEKTNKHLKSLKDSLRKKGIDVV